ncbi:MAG: Fe-S cluster biogenesis protein NfuA [Cognaticolwellia sp.]|jgi:Fe-S cluster biogenesis protein NfuA|tara:strand:- start:94 stop:708 length:615 start_codon:yes stop_codon:yes gene_type:complete
METTVKSPVLLYTEQTPNPESLKFVTNRMLYANNTADFRETDQELAKEWSPLATELFDQPYVRGVYICNNFVTITKEINYDWADVMLRIKGFLKTYVEEGNTIMKEGFEVVKAETDKENQAHYEGDDAEIVTKIIDLINTYVKPAVEMDGGNIEFKSYDKGTVTVELQGACSGCPSSTVTLQSGIEGMLKRMVPEVKEVVSEMG